MWFDSLRADFVFASRRLLQSRVTSAAAIVSLALEMGACLAAFQLIDALLLRPLPIAAPERLFALSRYDFGADGSQSTWPYPLFQKLCTAVANQAAVVAVTDAEHVEITFRSEAEMERAHVQYVSGGMFGTFGLHASLGRLFSSEDDLHPGAHPLAVLSYEYWTRRFARDPRAVGQTLQTSNNLTGTRVPDHWSSGRRLHRLGAGKSC